MDSALAVEAIGKIAAEYRGIVKRRIPLAFDFDGTLREGRGYRWPLTGRVDLTPMRQALARGYAVHVLTANDVDRVAEVLRAEGIDAVPDHFMDMLDWNGGQSGQTVLVTNRKMKFRMLVDDRAFHWRYGDNPDDIWAELDRRYPQAAPPQAPRTRRHRVRGWLRRYAESMAMPGTVPYGMF